MPDDKKLKVDFNERERAKHIETLRSIAKTATEGADALASGDDSGFMVHVVLLSLQGSAVNRIGKELAENLKKMREEEEFPSHIGG